ncbi:MAG: hypothetical protein OCD02_09250 [Spirochaetaceae bacterium]
MIKRAHGKYKIKLFLDILYVSIEGSTNVELFIDLEKELDIIRPKIEKPWVMILDFRLWDLGPQDFLEYMKSHSNRLKDNPDSTSTFIIIVDKNIQESILKNQAVHYSSKKGTFFSSNEETYVALIDAKFKGFDSFKEFFN